MKKYDLEKMLRQNGFIQRSGGKHDIWTKKGFQQIIVPRHRGDIPKGTLRNILRAAGLGSIIIAALKSGYLMAAEIMAEELQNHLDKSVTELEDKAFDYFLNRFGNHLIKLALLIPKGIDGALSTPILNDDGIFGVINLPIRVIDNFFKAEGYAQSIVNDWEKLIAYVKDNYFKENKLTNKETEAIANQYFSIGMEQFKKYCDMPSVRLETALAAIEAFNKAKELNPALPDLDRYIAVATEESNYLNNRLAEANQYFSIGMEQFKKYCDMPSVRLETALAAIEAFNKAKELNPALPDLDGYIAAVREESNYLNNRLAEADQHFNNGINQLKKYCDTDALRLETLAAAIDEFDKARKLNPALSDANKCITAASEEINCINNRIQQQQRMQAAIQQQQRNARRMHRVPVNNTANLSALHDSFFKELEKNRAIQNQQSAALQNNLKNLNIQLPVYNPNIPNSFDTLINYEKNKTPAERGGSTGSGYGGPGLFLRPCISRIELANGQVSINPQCSKKPL